MEEGRNKRRKKKKKKKIKIPKNKLQFGVHHCPLLDQIRQTFFFFLSLARFAEKSWHLGVGN